MVHWAPLDASPYRWVGIARQDCSYEPEPATPRLGAYQLPVGACKARKLGPEWSSLTIGH